MKLRRPAPQQKKETPGTPRGIAAEMAVVDLSRRRDKAQQPRQGFHGRGLVLCTEHAQQRTERERQSVREGARYHHVAAAMVMAVVRSPRRGLTYSIADHGKESKSRKQENVTPHLNGLCTRAESEECDKAWHTTLRARPLRLSHSIQIFSAGAQRRASAPGF